MPMPKALPAILFTALLTLPTFAIEDTASGLKVDLPADFIVEIAPTPQDYDVLIGVTTASGEPPVVDESPYLCAVAYGAIPQNAKLAQAEINAMIDTQEWGDDARRAMASVMDFSSTETFHLHGATGAEFIATPKIGPGHENIRLVMSMVETPKGRTVISCTATAATLKKALPIFHTIRDGVMPPR